MLATVFIASALVVSLDAAIYGQLTAKTMRPCRNIINVDNAYLRRGKTPFGYYYELTCCPGFRPNSTDLHVRCNYQTGDWILPLSHTRCVSIRNDVPSCGPMDLDIANGFIMAGCSHHWAKRRVGCYNGYRVVGEALTRCNAFNKTENNGWSHVGVCQEVECGEPEPVANGYYVRLSGSSRQVVCNPGYTHAPGSPRRIDCEVDNGTNKWTERGFCQTATAGIPPLYNNGGNAYNIYEEYYGVN